MYDVKSVQYKWLTCYKHPRKIFIFLAELNSLECIHVIAATEKETSFEAYDFQIVTITLLSKIKIERKIRVKF